MEEKYELESRDAAYINVLWSDTQDGAHEEVRQRQDEARYMGLILPKEKRAKQQPRCRRIILLLTVAVVTLFFIVIVLAAVLPVVLTRLASASARAENERTPMMRNMNTTNEIIAKIQHQLAAYETEQIPFMESINKTKKLTATLQHQLAVHETDGTLLVENITDLASQVNALKSRNKDVQDCLSDLLTTGSFGQSPSRSQHPTACKNIYPTDCSSLFSSGESKFTGVYWIWPTSSPQPFRVRCEMTDGGWTVLMRRYNGYVDFYCNWTEYRRGFGTLDTEFWLGNDWIHEISSQRTYTLRVEFMYWSNNSKYHADYQTFRVDSEADNYRLHVGGFSGNATYDALSYHNNQTFSTRDRDNDGMSGGSCAQTFHGAWWYDWCRFSQLTGLYLSTGDKCMLWWSDSGWNQLRAASMKVRPSI